MTSTYIHYICICIYRFILNSDTNEVTVVFNRFAISFNTHISNIRHIYVFLTEYCSYPISLYFFFDRNTYNLYAFCDASIMNAMVFYSLEFQIKSKGEDNYISVEYNFNSSCRQSSY
jgi:hypothetical protein